MELLREWLRELGRREADPAVLRAGLLGVVLVVAPLTILLGGTDAPRGEDFATRPWVFASDIPVAAFLLVALPTVIGHLKAGGGWGLRALAAVAVVLGGAWLFHPSAEGALQVFRVFGAVAVAAVVIDVARRDGWRVVIAVAALLQTALALGQIAVDGAVGLDVVGEMKDPFYPVGDASAPSGTLLHPYVLAAHALVAAGVIALRATTLRHTKLWPVAAAVAIAPVGFTFSRAAGLGAIGLAAALAVGATRDRARFGLVAVGVAGALLVTVALGAGGWSGRLAQTTTAGAASDLTTGRGELMRQAVDMIADQPVVGVGPGRYVEALPPPDQPGEIRKPVHNVPLLVAAEGGVLAGVAAALVLVAAAVTAVRGGWASTGLWLAFLPLLLLDHLAYTFPVGLVLLGVWVGALDGATRSRPRSSPAAPA